MEGYIGEVRMFAGNFAPMYWAFCQGQIMSIAENQALFSILGTTYGGNGQTTFGLPDLRSRVAVGTGKGLALSNYDLGQMAGVEKNTILPTNIPAHTHSLMVSSSNSDLATPVAGSTIAVTGTQDGRSFTPALCFNSATPNVALNVASITTVGGSNLPVNNIQPFLGMNYIICLEGIYPSRS